MSSKIDLNAALETLASIDRSKKIQAHGMTISQMEDLKEAQANDDVERVRANVNGSYTINKHEDHLIHITTQVPLFDQKTGLKPNPVLRKFYVKDFEKMSETEQVKLPNGSLTNPENAFRGLDVKIVHDPRKFTKNAKKEEPAKKEIPLTEMPIEDLHYLYNQLVGNNAPAGISKKDIIELIKEQQ